jgi:hypothetical protein
MVRSVAILSLFALPFAAAAPGNEANLSCALTALIRAKPTDPPAEASVGGWWYANADRTIWAGWDVVRMEAGSKGNKVLWFRPMGTKLLVKARRLDAEAAAVEADVPCCYGGRLQASGIAFPVDGCWEIVAKADNRELVFVTLVYPERVTH